MTHHSKTHSTNYYNAFITVADDTKAVAGIKPVSKSDRKTIAELQYELISGNPYRFTSDEILFQVYAHRNELIVTEHAEAKAQFFSKGQPCFRASPLPKTYGFGIHADEEGRVALYGVETNEYQRLVADEKIQKVKAMRTSKK